MRGLCECGCGLRTKLAKVNDPRKGRVKGRPNRFIHGHSGRGKNHGAWKGGVIIDGLGYRMVKRRGHPRANAQGYVREHLLIVERALGKPVPRSAVVHHINGTEGDNRPCNLVLCNDQAYHLMIEARQRALAGSGNANWLRCSLCKSWDDPANLRVRPDRNMEAVHPSCNAEYHRRRRAEARIRKKARGEVAA